MRGRGLKAPVREVLASHPDRDFDNKKAWLDHLVSLGTAPMTNSAASPARIASEGALWGSLHDHGFLRDVVVLSDGAGQFNLGLHALCWVHTERLFHKMVPTDEAMATAIEQVRERIWNLYRDFNRYRRTPTPQRKAALEQEA